MPPAFNLSQDQTLRLVFFCDRRAETRRKCFGKKSLPAYLRHRFTGDGGPYRFSQQADRNGMLPGRLDPGGTTKRSRPLRAGRDRPIGIGCCNNPIHMWAQHWQPCRTLRDRDPSQCLTLLMTDCSLVKEFDPGPASREVRDTTGWFLPGRREYQNPSDCQALTQSIHIHPQFLQPAPAPHRPNRPQATFPGAPPASLRPPRTRPL